MTGRIIRNTSEAWADADEWVEVEGTTVGRVEGRAGKKEAAGPSLSAAEVPPLGTPAALPEPLFVLSSAAITRLNRAAAALQEAERALLDFREAILEARNSA